MGKKFEKKPFVLNEEIMRPRYYFGDGFAFDSGIDNVWQDEALDYDTKVKSTEHYKLGDRGLCCHPEDPREWENLLFMNPEAMSADSRFGGGGLSEAHDRAEALRLMKEKVFCLFDLYDKSDWETCPGHYMWIHYSCEWEGCRSACAEVGESISATQAHFAFCRGAARQYALPWAFQFSFWHIGRINDYTGKAVWGICSKEKGGHSPELYKRVALLAYMGGASHFYPEAGFTINFRNELTLDGFYRLSPVGEMSRKLYDFVGRNPERGTSVAVFGIVLDRYHGMFSGNRRISKKKAFQTFDYTDGDDMTYDLLEALYPGSFNHYFSREASYMVNGIIGETADVLLQGVSEEVINAYPCILLTGDIRLDDDERAMYRRYAENGGTLILNTAYLEFFPEYAAEYNGRLRCDIATGNGKVVIYGPEYKLHTLLPVLKEEVARRVPFTMTEQVDFMLNAGENFLTITLMNNSGYYFDFDNGEDIDTAETKTFTLSYTGDCEVEAVSELWSGESLEPADSFEVTLTPAEVKIFRFDFRAK